MEIKRRRRTRSKPVSPRLLSARAVNRARRRGELLNPIQHRCYGCNGDATLYHHPSYHPDDCLCVVPLCKACHGLVHRLGNDMVFGVVATRFGVVRIAIAGDSTFVVTPVPPIKRRGKHSQIFIKPDTRARLNLLKAQLTVEMGKVMNQDDVINLLLDVTPASAIAHSPTPEPTP